MLRTLKELEHYRIGAIDGDVGRVKDIYFDDDGWVIRYLVVDTGDWLASRRVLISPISIRHPQWSDRILPVSITREQVRNSPDIDADKPVSRQHEMDFLGYYSYPDYWGGSGLWGDAMEPYAMMPGYAGFDSDPAERKRAHKAFAREQRLRHRHDDPHLRSGKAIEGYRIHATDGEIGRVHDFIVDEDTWAIRYIVVATGSWWHGHEVLLAPMWITAIDWLQRSVSVDMPRESVRQSPPCGSTSELNRQQESRLYEYYGRPGYWWTDEPEHTPPA